MKFFCTECKCTVYIAFISKDLHYCPHCGRRYSLKIYLTKKEKELDSQDESDTENKMGEYRDSNSDKP